MPLTSSCASLRREFRTHSPPRILSAATHTRQNHPEGSIPLHTTQGCAVLLILPGGVWLHTAPCGLLRRNEMMSDCAGARAPRPGGEALFAGHDGDPACVHTRAEDQSQPVAPTVSFAVGRGWAARRGHAMAEAWLRIAALGSITATRPPCMKHLPHQHRATGLAALPAYPALQLPPPMVTNCTNAQTLPHPATPTPPTPRPCILPSMAPRLPLLLPRSPQPRRLRLLEWRQAHTLRCCRSRRRLAPCSHSRRSAGRSRSPRIPSPRKPRHRCCYTIRWAFQHTAAPAALPA